MDINKTFIGKTVEVLVEGESKRNPNQLFGKTDGFKTTVFHKNNAETKQFVKVKITDATAHTLLGNSVLIDYNETFPKTNSTNSP